MTGRGERPIPVRELLAGARGPRHEEVEGSPDASGAEARAAPRILVVEGVRWQVEAIGRGRSGHPPDSGATLLHLAFTQVSEPGPGGERGAAHDAANGTSEGADAPRREGIAVARELDDLSDEALEALLARSRPGAAGPGVSR